MTEIYYDRDVDSSLLQGKTIGIIGYGNQGTAQAHNMRDSGLKIVLGLRENGPSWKKARQDGFEVCFVSETVKRCDIIHLLIPDEVQGRVYQAQIKDNLRKGQVLMFSHGFAIRFQLIVPPENIDVVMVAPKGVGIMVRKNFLQGGGVPSLIAVHQDYSGQAKEIALALAASIGSGKAGIIEATFKDETDSDLFSEQVNLCGGVAELVNASFEVLTKRGYSPEAAYFECLYELKLIVDLIQKGGLEYMWKCVSNTAEYGGRTRGKRIIDNQVKKNMEEILQEVQSGKFAHEWVKEYEDGMPNLITMRERGAGLEIEKVGSRLRRYLYKKTNNK